MDSRLQIKKILCLDVGDARIGLAVSDGLMSMAHPLEVVERAKGQPARKIACLARQIEADLILVGLPLNMDGSQGPQAHKALGFAEQLRQETPGTKIATWDERLTTRHARELRIEAGAGKKKRAQPVDALSAALILQNYLDFLAKQATTPPGHSDDTKEVP